MIVGGVMLALGFALGWVAKPAAGPKVAAGSPVAVSKDLGKEMATDSQPAQAPLATSDNEEVNCQSLPFWIERQ